MLQFAVNAEYPVHVAVNIRYIEGISVTKQHTDYVDIHLENSHCIAPNVKYPDCCSYCKVPNLCCT